MSAPSNAAAWLLAKHGRLVVGPAPFPTAGPNEIVVENRAVAVNPLEWILQLVGGVIYPWLDYPFVIGSDVAGVVVEAGSAVTRFAVGDRVLGHATGTDKDENSAAAGGFQRYTVLNAGMASPIPDGLPFENAAVLPLGLSTAACALFEKDQLALAHPSDSPVATGETVLVWGGSTSVGSNAIQLAVAAGYEVVTTASPANFAYVAGLGAGRVFDYSSPTVVADLVSALRGKRLAGAVALGTGSATPVAAVVRASEGRRVIAIASTPVSFAALGDGGSRARLPFILMRMGAAFATQAVTMRLRGIRTTTVWGSALKSTEVGPLIYEHFLPAALAEGRYVAAPDPLVVGSGLESVQLALDTQRAGVSARKVVITL